MDEIKFNAYNKKTKKYFPVSMNTEYKPNIWNHKDYILFQFTGMKDKKGKEIYEGNVVAAMVYDRNKQKFIAGKIVRFVSSKVFMSEFRLIDLSGKFYQAQILADIEVISNM